MYYFIITYFIKKIRLLYHVVLAHFLCSAYYGFASCSFTIYGTFVLFSFSSSGLRIFQAMRPLLFLSLVMDSRVLCRSTYTKNVTDFRNSCLNIKLQYGMSCLIYDQNYFNIAAKQLFICGCGIDNMFLQFLHLTLL